MAKRDFGYGRGGAGNLDAVAQENARIAEDLEASRSDAGALTESPTVYVQRQEPSYVGRGGSGNYGSLKESGNWDGLDQATEVPFSNIRKDSQPQSPTYGRGGAGNYTAGSVEGKQKASRRKTEDEQKREKLKEEVEKGVHEQLAIPQKAKLPAGNPY